MLEHSYIKYVYFQNNSVIVEHLNGIKTTYDSTKDVNNINKLLKYQIEQTNEGKKLIDPPSSNIEELFN